MKALAMILTLILAQQVLASNSCFDTQAVKDLIKASEKLDKYFSDDEGSADIKELSIEDQKATNSSRLIPIDRTAGDGFLNRATGAVSAEIPGVGSRSASAQKISRCHIITSAHFIYGSGKVPLSSNGFDINFHSGQQTCDQDMPFKNKTSAKIVFKMADAAKKDFKCDRLDKYGKCELRQFNGHSDLVILKLDKYDRNDYSFFKLNVSNPNSHKSGQRVNCWGYPEHNSNIKLSQPVSDMMLWGQKDAQIFGDDNGKSFLGVITNAISYKSMSGGGCVVASNPRELVGVFAKGNSGTGRSAVDVKVETEMESGANYLSAFQKLEQRYNAENARFNKTLSELDKECD